MGHSGRIIHRLSYSLLTLLHLLDCLMIPDVPGDRRLMGPADSDTRDRYFPVDRCVTRVFYMFPFYFVLFSLCNNLWGIVAV